MGHEKPIYRRGLPKKGGLNSLLIQWGLGKKEGGGVFLGEGGGGLVDTPIPTMKFLSREKKW